MYKRSTLILSFMISGYAAASAPEVTSKARQFAVMSRQKEDICRVTRLEESTRNALMGEEALKLVAFMQQEALALEALADTEQLKAITMAIQELLRPQPNSCGTGTISRHVNGYDTEVNSFLSKLLDKKNLDKKNYE